MQWGSNALQQHQIHELLLRVRTSVRGQRPEFFVMGSPIQGKVLFCKPHIHVFVRANPECYPQKNVDNIDGILCRDLYSAALS